MKKGFTLVELLIVVAVITILMSITFRIMGAAESQKERNITVRRLHALESAIGGYYAAFGSYPPVRLHGSRNIYCMLNDQGIQILDEINEDEIDPDRVMAACRSQPVAMEYPFPDRYWPKVAQTAEKLRNMYKNKKGGVNNAAKTNFDALTNPYQLAGKKDESEWTELNLFKFGLMSFLLPRFLFMMRSSHTTIYDDFTQWGDNNNIPCRFVDGMPYRSWADLAEDVRPASKSDGSFDGDYGRDAWKVALLPSQIVTARWIACLEECCQSQLIEVPGGEIKVWGVNILGHEMGDNSDLSESGMTVRGRYPPVYSSGGLQSVGNDWSQAYALDGISCRDGWGMDFLYYSPPPHQGYRLWSSGENKKTFPPWISESEIEQLGSAKAKMVRGWRVDDIVHMSN